MRDQLQHQTALEVKPTQKVSKQHLAVICGPINIVKEEIHYLISLVWMI